MRSNRDRHAATRTGERIARLATPALTLALMVPLVACEGYLADPAPAAALQSAGVDSDADDPSAQIGHGLFHLLDELELSADQQAALERIRMELRERNEPLHEQIRSTLGMSDNDSPRRFGFRGMSEDQREALRPAFEQLRGNQRAAMEQVWALLTPAQRQTLESLRAERKARWEEHRADAAARRAHGGRPLAGAMLRLPSDLELTRDQQAELERIRSELRERNEPLHEQIRSELGTSDADTPRRFALRGATAEQRETLRPVFEQLRANQREAMEQVTALLTPEQQEKFDALRAERRSRGPASGGFPRGRRVR